MTTKFFRVFGMTATVLAASATLSSALAELVYDNSSNDRFTREIRNSSNIREFGDEINLGGTYRNLSQFRFQYYGTNVNGGSSFAGNVQVTLRLRANDGTLYSGYARPGTELYRSQPFSVGVTYRDTLIYDLTDLYGGGAALALSGPVPNTFTWTVEFSGLAAGDEVGLDVFDPPTVGSSYNDFWFNDSVNGWILLTNASVNMNFAAQVHAVPEPGTLWLLALGGLACFPLIRRFRKN